MDINFSKEDIAFRDEVRDWLANDYPKHVKEKTDAGITISKEDLIDFHKALSKKGWMGYNWPVEYGGTGWSASKLYIFNIDDSAPGWPPFSRADKSLNSVISIADNATSSSLTFFWRSELSSLEIISFNLLSCLIEAPTPAIPNLSCASKNLA